MVLAHKRPHLLPLIVDQVTRTWPACAIDIALDRPSLAVLQAADAAAKQPAVRLLSLPFPVLTHKENFMEARRWQLDQMRAREPRYAALWDDDQVLECPDEARQLMDERVDLIYAVKAYFWDALEQTAHHLPEHRSVFFFRLRPGDQFPLDRTINAPVAVHDDPLSVAATLHGRLLDVGYLSAEERARVFKAYSQVGKLDAVTKSLVTQPELKPFVPYRYPAREYLKLKDYLEPK